MRFGLITLTIAFFTLVNSGCKIAMDDSESGTMGGDSSAVTTNSLLANPVLVVTGLSVEALIASDFGVTTVSSGGDATKLQSLLAQYNSSNVRGVVSFGIAGGLDPSLQPGDVVVLSRVIENGVTYTTDPTLSATVYANIAKIAGSQFSVVQGAGAASSTSVLDSNGKAALWQSTHAEVVDMESEMAAAFAAANGLPFVAVRAVADPYNQTQPPAATVALLPDGSVDLSAVVNSIATSPSQLPALWMVALQTEAAFSALTQVHQAVDFATVFP